MTKLKDKQKHKDKGCSCCGLELIGVKTMHSNFKNINFEALLVPYYGYENGNKEQEIQALWLTEIYKTNRS